MGILDQITQMRSQGMSDDDIIEQLQEKGIPPKVINDALNNEQIKKAVSDEYEAPAPSNQENYQEPQESADYYSPEQNPQETYSPQDYSQGYEYSGGGLDTSTIIEIAEQVFSEKSQNIQRKVDDLTEFKAVINSKVDAMSERLRRIEMMIDKLQITILEKVGSYGNNLENIKKEMSMMQDTFGKAVGRKPQQIQRQENQNENVSKPQKSFPKGMNKEQ
ncbi:hypothetical protein HYT24_02195 [Candidatus Pacearchaeota archaeon]|nr:hypothetical protein [Candidatus Pacearchaeota archaeon]